MLATGGLLVSIAVLTLAAVAPVFRSETPPQWATRGWVGEVVTLAIVCTLAIGIGYLGAGAIGAVQTGLDFLDLGLLALVLLGAAVLWRRLGERARRRAGGVGARDHTSAAPPATMVAKAAPGPAAASVPRPHKAA